MVLENTKRYTEASLSASDTYTDEIVVKDSATITIDGTWSGTIRVYWRPDGYPTPKILNSYIGTNNPISVTFNKLQLDSKVKVGFGPGDYTSGTANVLIGI